MSFVCEQEFSNEPNDLHYEYSIENNKLRIDFCVKGMIGFKKTSFYLTIEELTEEKMILSFIPSKNNFIMETFGGERKIFKKSNITCDEFSKLHAFK